MKVSFEGIDYRNGPNIFCNLCGQIVKDKSTDDATGARNEYSCKLLYKDIIVYKDDKMEIDDEFGLFEHDICLKCYNEKIRNLILIPAKVTQSTLKKEGRRLMVKKKVVSENDLIPGAILVPTSDLPDTTQLSEPDPNVVLRPKMSSPAWSDYVLSQFEDTELFEGYPKVEGLRRVTELLLGPIVVSNAGETKLKSCLTRDGVETLNFWVGSHHIEINVVYEEDYRGVRQFTEVGNVNAHNTKNEMLRWGPEFASTRAESRALRKALKLKTMSYEEATAPPLEELEITPDTLCTSSQKNFLMNIAERNNIDIYKYIKAGKNSYNKLDEIPFKVAIKMIEFLSECQRDPSKIPEGVKK